MRFVCLTVWLCAGLIATGATADQPGLKPALESRYAAMKSAMAAHDAPAISAVLAPDFVSIDVAGKVETAAQMIAEVTALKPDPNKTSTTTLTSIVQTGDKATVEQRYEMRTVKVGANGARHKVVLVTRSTDTWVDWLGVWLMSKTATDDLVYSVDGRVVAHIARE